MIEHRCYCEDSYTLPCFRTHKSPQNLREKSTTSTSRGGLTTAFPLTQAVSSASYKT